MVEEYNAVVNGAKKAAKNWLFDIVAFIIILLLIVVNLDVFDVKHLTFDDIMLVLTSAIPYFAATMLLTSNFYNKGAFTAKATPKYINIVKEYSRVIDSLTGKMLSVLDDFCTEYNANAIKRKRELMLRSVGVSYDEFEANLQGLNEKDLRDMKKFSDLQIARILETQRAKIKGISTTVLLCSISSDDATYLGRTEASMQVRQLAFSSVTYVFFSLLFAFIGWREISEWGWGGIFLVLFKLLFSLGSSLLKYFNGYNDISNNTTAYISRKLDILKEFGFWYEEYEQNINKTLDISDKNDIIQLRMDC